MLGEINLEKTEEATYAIGLLRRNAEKEDVGRSFGSMAMMSADCGGIFVDGVCTKLDRTFKTVKYDISDWLKVDSIDEYFDFWENEEIHALGNYDGPCGIGFEWGQAYNEMATKRFSANTWRIWNYIDYEYEDKWRDGQYYYFLWAESNYYTDSWLAFT
jgi:hypothetical protein